MCIVCTRKEKKKASLRELSSCFVCFFYYHSFSSDWSILVCCKSLFFFNSSSNNYCCWCWCAKINLWKMKIVEPEHPRLLSCHNTSNQSNVCDNHRMTILMQMMMMTMITMVIMTTMLMQLMMMMMKQANQISPQSIGAGRSSPQWQVSLQLSMTFKIFACC